MVRHLLTNFTEPELPGLLPKRYNTAVKHWGFPTFCFFYIIMMNDANVIPYLLGEYFPYY